MAGDSYFFGDWKVLEDVLRNTPNIIKKTNERSLRRVSLKAERMAVKFVRNQNLSWKPLSEKYLKAKVKAGKSNKILIGDSDYIQSITSGAKGNKAVTGVSKTAKNKEGDKIANIGMVQEYGSIARNIPARPLWSVVHKHMRTFILHKQFFAREVDEELKKIAKAKSKPKKKFPPSRTP